MKREILETESFTAMFEDGALMEYLPKTQDSAAGAVYLGRITRYVPGMQAVFVDIGFEKNGFLPLAEVNNPVARELQAGTALLVQVKRDQTEEKGVFLTQQITLPGVYSVFLPLGAGVGVSAKIQDADLRHVMKEMTVPYGGAVIRTAAQYVPLEAVQQELDELANLYQNLLRDAKGHTPPKVLWMPRNPQEKLRQDYAGRCEDTESDFALENQLKEAFNRRVWLKSGGCIVIDSCEALTAIDVNTGKFLGTRQQEATILKTNLEACEKIAQQARLRNLSGIIVVDFIDMQSEDDRQAVYDKLTEAFSADRKQVDILGFTKLGLMEITRKRDSLPLNARMKE